MVARFCRAIWLKIASPANVVGRMYCARCGAWAFDADYREQPANEHTRLHYRHVVEVGFREATSVLRIHLCGPCELSEHAREQAIQTREVVLATREGLGALTHQVSRLAAAAEETYVLLNVLTATTERLTQAQEALLVTQQRREAIEIVQHHHVHGPGAVRPQRVKAPPAEHGFPLRKAAPPPPPGAPGALATQALRLPGPPASESTTTTTTTTYLPPVEEDPWAATPGPSSSSAQW